MISRTNESQKACGRLVQEKDFFGGSGIPVDAAALSDTTPGATIFNDNYVGITESLAEVAGRRPGPKASRQIRLKYWLGEGMPLRTNRLIAHVIVGVNERGPGCFWCQSRPRSGWLVCYFCGEMFCGAECEQAFHRDKLETLDTQNSPAASDEVAEDTNIDFKTPKLHQSISRRNKAKPNKSGQESVKLGSQPLITSSLNTSSATTTATTTTTAASSAASSTLPTSSSTDLTTDDDTPTPEIPIQVDQTLDEETRRRLLFNEEEEHNNKRSRTDPI